MRYGVHAFVTKETVFVSTELATQSWAGHIVLFPLAAIPQQGRKPRFIYDLYWSGVNKEATQVAHKEAKNSGRPSTTK